MASMSRESPTHCLTKRRSRWSSCKSSLLNYERKQRKNCTEEVDEGDASEPIFRQDWPAAEDRQQDLPADGAKEQHKRVEGSRGLKQDDECSVVTEGGTHRRGKEAEQVRIPNLPKAPQLCSWRLAARDEVGSASGDPDAGFAWTRQTELQGATMLHG